MSVISWHAGRPAALSTPRTPGAKRPLSRKAKGFHLPASVRTASYSVLIPEFPQVQISPKSKKGNAAGGSKGNPAMVEKNFAVGETPSFANTENSIAESENVQAIY